MQFVNGFGGDDGAGRTDRMPQRDARTVRVHLGRVEAQFLSHRARLCREGLVGLDDVDVLQLQSGALQHPAGGRYRADAHVQRLHPGMGVADQTGQRLQAQRGRPLCVGQHDRGGTVVEAGRIARRHRAVFFLEDRLHLGQRLQADVCAHMFVGVESHHALARLHLHRGDLFAEAALGDRAGGALLAFQGQCVLHLAADAVTGCDVLGSDAHMHLLPWVVEDAVHVVHHAGVAHARAPAQGRHDVGAPAHRFGAAADGDVGVAERDGLGRRDDRLQARAAQAVDVEGRRLLRDAGIDGRHPAQVGVARFGGNHVAHHHMADLGRLYAGAGQRRADGDRGQLGHRGVLERATIGADGRARGADDENFALCHRRVLVLSGRPPWPAGFRDAVMLPGLPASAGHTSGVEACGPMLSKKQKGWFLMFGFRMGDVCWRGMTACEQAVNL